MKKKSSKPVIPFLLAIFVIALAIGYNKIKDGNVLGRSYPPSSADIPSKAGGTINSEGIILIVAEGTFDENVYFRVDKTARGNPISVDGLWQISDIWDARVKYMSNNDQVNEFAAHNNYILSFPYTTQFLTTDQGLYISPSSLKIVRGETVTGPWTVMDNSVVDETNKTVSIITNRGGFFMIAGGFYQSPSKNREKTVILKENEVVITIDPTQKFTTPAIKVSIEPEISEPIAKNEKEVKGNIFTSLYTFIHSFFQ